MSNEFKHSSVGTELSQAEWEAIATHIADGQVAGDILYFDGTYWKRRPYNIGARVYHNTDQSIPDSTTTTLSFNSEDFDSDTIHDNTTNNDRLTCKTAGIYTFFASICFNTNATGFRCIQIVKNGSTMLTLIQSPAVSGNLTVISTSHIIDLAVNDYLTCRVYQNSGGALSVRYMDHYSPMFGIQRVG